MKENEYTEKYKTEEERQAFINGYQKALDHFKFDVEYYLHEEIKWAIKNPLRYKEIVRCLLEDELNNIQMKNLNNMYDYGFKDIFHDISEDVE